MSRTAARALLVVLLSALAGCAGPPGPPWPEVISPGGITLRWYPDETSAAAAQQVADAHCAEDARGSAEIASYRCR